MSDGQYSSYDRGEQAMTDFLAGREAAMPELTAAITREVMDWCEPDDCPAVICSGPHVRYVNDAGDECIAPRGAEPLPGFRLPT